MHEKAKFVCFIYMKPQKNEIQICSNKHETGLVQSISSCSKSTSPQFILGAVNIELVCNFDFSSLFAMCFGLLKGTISVRRFRF